MFALASIVEEMLKEASPSLLSRAYQPLTVSTASPVGRATLGWDLAVKHVMECDDTYLVADWQRRQRMLKGWLDHLKTEEPGDSAEVIAGRLARGDDVDLGAALFAPGWHDMLSEIEEAQAWAMQRYAEQARKAQIIGEGYRQLAAIENHYREQMTAIVAAAEVRIEQLRDDGATRRLIAGGQREAAAVSAAAVERIRDQIRQILDLDENTAAVTVDAWLAGHLPVDG
jgi:hypothetical protein